MDIFRGTPRIFPDFFFKIYDISKNILVNLQIIFLIVEKNDIFLGSPQIFLIFCHKYRYFEGYFGYPQIFSIVVKKMLCGAPGVFQIFAQKTDFCPKK